MTIDLTYQFIAGMTVALKCAWLCEFSNNLYFPKAHVFHATTAQG